MTGLFQRLRTMSNAIWARRYVSTIAVIFTLGGLGGLSGCHPCSFVQCGSWVNAEVYSGANGEIYIDIPDRKKFVRAELLDLSVTQLRDGKFSGYFWSISKSNNPSTPRQLQSLDVSELPLRYGGDVPRTIIEIPPKKIENGVYHIRGFVFLFDDKEKHTANITGDFSYENGVVKNLK